MGQGGKSRNGTRFGAAVMKQCPRYEHNFPFPNARCLKCGISQVELSRPIKQVKDELKPKLVIKEPQKGIYTEAQELATELAELFREPKKFGMYCGIIKRLGVSAVRRILSEIKSAKPRNPIKFFMWKTKKPKQ